MSRQLFEEARKVLTQEAAVKLDPVGQEDKDIDNDGDSDKTDSYLKKRRGAISAAIAKSKNESALSEEDLEKLKAILGEMKKKEEMEDEEEDEEEDDEKKMKKEEVEQVDEMQVANKYALKGPQPSDVPAYMRKGNARKTFPVKLDDLKRKDTMSDVENLRKMEGVMSDLDADRKDRAYQTHQARTTMKHIPNPTAGEKTAAKDIKPGVAGYRDRIAMLKSAEARGGLKKEEVEDVAEGSEQLDEISKGLASRYINKAARRAGVHSAQAADYAQTAGDETATRGQKMAAQQLGAAQKHKRDMRLQGIQRATSTLAKEEVDQIDEKAKWRSSSAAEPNPEHDPEEYAYDKLSTGSPIRSKADKPLPYGSIQSRQGTEVATSGLRKGMVTKKSAERLKNRIKANLNIEEVEDVTEDFELIEKLNFEVAENPSYQDYFKAALKIAQVESFAELDEEDQQYIISEMETAFRQNDTSFILEADAMGDMNDTVQRLRKAGHKIEDMGRDFKGNPFYMYVDKGSNMRRKVTYKGTQKVTQNMGRAQPEKEEE